MKKSSFLANSLTRTPTSNLTKRVTAVVGGFFMFTTHSVVVSAGARTFAQADDVKSVFGWLQTIINLLSAMIGLVVVISLIVAGIQYMTAGSNSSQVAAAKNRISMAILALIFFGLTYALLQWLIPGGAFQS